MRHKEGSSVSRRRTVALTHSLCICASPDQHRTAPPTRATRRLLTETEFWTTASGNRPTCQASSPQLLPRDGVIASCGLAGNEAADKASAPLPSTTDQHPILNTGAPLRHREDFPHGQQQDAGPQATQDCHCRQQSCRCVSRLPSSFHMPSPATDAACQANPA